MTQRARAVVPDRVAVRFISPETGGAARPRFLTEREIAFFARIEALIEQVPIEADVYPERYVRAATDRLVARAMLASLLVAARQRAAGSAALALDARAELADRIGGAAVLDDALQREGIDESELIAFLRDQVRATWYVDKAITPIIAVTEDSLREAFRSDAASVSRPEVRRSARAAAPLARRGANALGGARVLAKRPGAHQDRDRPRAGRPPRRRPPR